MKSNKILKLALVKSGISQVTASEWMGVNLSTVHRQCNSQNPTLSTIVKYAGICNMKPSELIALGE
jgi:hypothetical protein